MTRRSFVTNGPVLEFSANERSLGETVRLDAAGPVRVRAKAEAQAPLSRVELVQNGVVVASGALAADKLSGAIDETVRIEKSGWLGFRAFGAGSVQAHTSPIYVEVGGKPAGSKKDAEYFLAWIDRLEAKLKERDRLPSPGLKKHVENQLAAARDVYRKVAAESE